MRVVEREKDAQPSDMTRDVSEHDLRHQHSHTFSDIHESEQQQQQQQHQSNGRSHPLQNQVYSEDQNHDDSAASYMARYLQSRRSVIPRPAEPIPRRAALIPPTYPYPFSHVLRNNTYSAYPVHTAPFSIYDPNHPSIIKEQLAPQMQMYALNNHAALADPTFSPSSTPFPGPGYNPWTFLQASRVSNQSSPSHQPVSLPFPTAKGRGSVKQRQASADLRVQSVKRKVKTPQMQTYASKSLAGSTEERRESPALPVRPTIEDTTDVSEHDLRHQHSRTFSAIHGSEQQQQQHQSNGYGRSHPLQDQVYSEDQNHDDATASSISHYFQSLRPVAFIPPTSHSRTAAPSPLISSIQASPAPPVGSPPHFLTQFYAMEENWQMIEELTAEIERADFAQDMSMVQQPLLSNTLLLPPAIETRLRDKSLPVQEEPEDGFTAFKNGDTQRSHHLEDDNDTLIENDIEFPTGGDEDHDGEHTPRSLTANLPELYPARQYTPQPANQCPANLSLHHVLLADAPEEPLEVSFHSLPSRCRLISLERDLLGGASEKRLTNVRSH